MAYTKKQRPSWMGDGPYYEVTLNGLNLLATLSVMHTVVCGDQGNYLVLVRGMTRLKDVYDFDKPEMNEPSLPF